MPAKGKHRRSRYGSLTRGFIAAGTGGAALVLPLIGATSAGAAPQAAAAEKADSVIYAVMSGDSLSKIAGDHSVAGGWKKLYQDNREAVGANPSLIRPGLELTIARGAEAKTEAEAETPASSERADRSERKTAPAAESDAPAVETASYSNDLDGWIKESLAVMAKHGIPGTYEGIHRNIMRESSGNPRAINNWDSNAVAGTPSKGLLQVIQPTFQAYHVPGTSTDSYDPVANITAACNYAADRYGSIDNVNGPY
ncbi:transglycosylase SLT domain-containing protein [Streptomyces sp. Wb2n-11]|uniref:transglycosylase SLT domain-containing protein n=1 Tax=Streptomyces sp. Wb2n-11 TaxID=1030533 RepID=UPI000B1F25A1|nr:LysM peptidoglycan-binding domain-containing protein [Streptomyces sp. Wb2n-11]